MSPFQNQKTKNNKNNKSMKKLVIPFSLLSLIAIGCSNAQVETISEKAQNTQINDSLLIGKWTVERVEEINDPYSIMNDSVSINMISFFGAQSWSNSKGKQFNFKNDGTLQSNLMLDEDKFARIKPTYKLINNNEIIFSFSNPRTNQKIEILERVEVINNKIICIVLDDYFKLTLKKE